MLDRLIKVNPCWWRGPCMRNAFAYTLINKNINIKHFYSCKWNILLAQHHCCWFPGSSDPQDISDHGIYNRVWPYSCIPWGTISTRYLRQHWKWKYGFVSPQINSVRQTLNILEILRTHHSITVTHQYISVINVLNDNRWWDEMFFKLCLFGVNL